MPALRFSPSEQHRCLSKRGDLRCELTGGHLHAHRAGEIQWTDLATDANAIEIVSDLL